MKENQHDRVVSPKNDEFDSQFGPKLSLSKGTPVPNERNDRLKSPSDDRPLELSWMLQNKSHDNYKYII